jgi:hypothetical protein
LSTQTTDYGCLMLKLPINKWDLLTNAIKSADLWTERTGFGRELEPHVTILYGFHDDVDEHWIKDCVYQLKKPVEVVLKSISHFENPLYDVVKFDIDSPRLHRLNEIFSKFPNTQKYGAYNPHATIAYVKKGLAEKYHRELKNPIRIMTNTFIFSKPKGKTYEWVNDKLIPVRTKDLYYSLPGNRI